MERSFYIKKEIPLSVFVRKVDANIQKITELCADCASFLILLQENFKL